jgi:hypothetical protein
MMTKMAQDQKKMGRKKNKKKKKKKRKKKQPHQPNGTKLMLLLTKLLKFTLSISCKKGSWIFWSRMFRATK